MISSLLHLVGLRPRVYDTLTNFRGGGGKATLAPPQYANASIYTHPRPSIYTHPRPSIYTHPRPSIYTRSCPSIYKCSCSSKYKRETLQSLQLHLTASCKLFVNEEQCLAL